MQFPHRADQFAFSFINNALELSGAGITGQQTNTSIEVSLVGASLENQIYFSGANPSSGSASLFANSIGEQSGADEGSVRGVVGSQISSTGPLSMGNGGSFSATNAGQDSSNGDGNNTTARVSASQLNFANGIVSANHTTFTATNGGTYTGSNSVNGNNTASIGNHQLECAGPLQSGDFLKISLSNIGANSSSGSGNNFVGTIFGPQATFNDNVSIGDNGTFFISCNGANSCSSSLADFVGYILEQQLYVSGNLLAGDFFSLSTNLSGEDSSSGPGGHIVGMVDSFSGSYGNQVQIDGSCTLGDNASIVVVKSGTYTGINTIRGPIVGSLNQNQIKIGNAFQAGDFFNFNVTNSAADSGNGNGGDVVAPISNLQAWFGSTCSVGEYAAIHIGNSAVNSGTNSAPYNNVGAIGNAQLNIDGAFTADDFLNLTLENISSDTSHGNGSNFIGSIIGKGQALFNQSCSIGNNATISISNDATNSSLSSGNTNLGSFTANGCYQLLVQDIFQAGDNLNLIISNTALDVSIGQGNNLVGSILNGGQVLFRDGCLLGDNATIHVSNDASGSNGSISPNNVGVMSLNQLYVIGNFIAGNNLNLLVENSAAVLDGSQDSVGIVGGGQVLFAGACAMGAGSTICALNTGTVNGTQIYMDGGFTVSKGKATISALNRGTVNSGEGILIYGESQGGDANIVLENSSFYVASSTPTFTIGELNGDSASNAKSIPMLIIDTDADTYGNFAGVIEDPPSYVTSLIKQGSGSQKLSGINTYTGLTSIEEGALILNGSLVGDVLVNPSGILKGTGTIGGTVTNTGTIAPGESIGTLTILGDFLNNGGNYALELAGAQSDLINVSGSTLLNGGSLVLSSIHGGYQIQQPYTILTSDSLTGTFSQILAPPLLNAVVTYDEHSVHLTLQTAISRAARTSNQSVIARKLDELANPNTDQALVLSRLISLSLPAAQEALESLSGYQHTADLFSITLLNRQFIRRLYDPLRSIVTNEWSDCCCDCEFVTWMEGSGGYSRLHGDKNAHGFHFDSSAVTVGVQQRLPCHLTCGIAGSYAWDHLHYKQGGYENSDTCLFGLYALYRPACYYGLIDLTSSYTTGSITRKIWIGPSLRLRAHSKPKISNYAFYGELGFDLPVDCLLIQPFVGIQTGRVQRRHLSECWAEGWGLNIHQRSHFSSSSRVGLHISTDLPFWCTNIALDVAWNKLLSTHRNDTEGRFIALRGDFPIEGIEFPENGADYALTVSSCPYDFLTAYIELNGEVWDNFNTLNLLGGIELCW